MQKGLSNNDYKTIRTVNMFKGRVASIKYIRQNYVSNYLVAVTLFDDVISKKPWTKPQIEADLNGVF